MWAEASSQSLSDPRTSHLEAVKRILKYVHGTRKAPLEGFFLGNNLISWLSKKQNCFSMSTAKAEYIAARSACTQTITEHALGVPENHMSDIDFDDLNDESSSTEGVFVPTPSLQHTSTFEPGPSLYSSLVQSPTPHSTSSSLKNDPASPPADETAALERGTDVHNDDDELDPVIPKVNTCEIPVDVDVDNTLAAPTESPAFPKISRPAKKKLQQN
ncbi:putative mitochondrial protein [Cucumis melo var. makuwa]|uniref:Mitochondrial protein n=1 Tax=Cucumis melo var. makuwa TaxID=1194695 RepID=A0A5A7TVL3_CUCMM|nr:putative mitochondrial protein [Cucumis melo var. makuwa]